MSASEPAPALVEGEGALPRGEVVQESVILTRRMALTFLLPAALLLVAFLLVPTT